MSQAVKADYVDPILKRYGFNNIEDLYAAIALGAITATKVVSKLRESYRQSLPPEEQTELLLKQIEKENKKKAKTCPKAAWL